MMAAIARNAVHLLVVAILFCSGAALADDVKIVPIPKSVFSIQLPVADWETIQLEGEGSTELILIKRKPDNANSLLAMLRVSNDVVVGSSGFEADKDKCFAWVISTFRGTAIETRIRQDGLKNGCASGTPINQTVRNWIRRENPQLVELLAKQGLVFGGDVVSMRVSELTSKDARLNFVGYFDGTVDLQTEFPPSPEKKSMLTLNDWAKSLGSAIVDSVSQKRTVLRLPELSFARQ